MGDLRVPTGTAADYTSGRIERVDLATGRFERVYDGVDGNRLSGPNDLVFDRTGHFWFTDLGKRFARHRDLSGLYAAADGSKITEAAYGISLNGVGLSPDDSTVYCNETETARLRAFDLASPGAIRPESIRGRLICTLPGMPPLDSLAVETDGNISAATILNGAGLRCSHRAGRTNTWRCRKFCPPTSAPADRTRATRSSRCREPDVRSRRAAPPRSELHCDA